MKEGKTIVGLMSGTSANGIDAAIVGIEENKRSLSINLLNYNTYEFNSTLKEKILDASNPERSNVDLICSLNFVLGQEFAEAVFKIAEETKIGLNEIDIIGSHGQTVCHMPKAYNSVPSSLQLGEPSVIAVETGITTVADFRVADIAAGGQGAPLTAFPHKVLFGSDNVSRLIINLGGIVNITLLPKCCLVDEVIAFDTGPGNMVIDGIVMMMSNGKEQMDMYGKTASKGKISAGLLDFMFESMYLKLKPPKTTGREDFGSLFIKKIVEKGRTLGLSYEDILATATRFTVESIIYNYKIFIKERCCIDEIILCGGGTKNNLIVRWLKEEFSSIPVFFSEKCGYLPCSVEAICFAILAYYSFNGIACNIPSVTGASKKVVLGKIVTGTAKTLSSF